MEYEEPNSDGLPIEDQDLRQLREELLPHFTATIDQLHSLDDDDAILETSLSLHVAARHIRFALGRPEKRSPELVQQIIALFREAGDLLFSKGTHLREAAQDGSALYERATSIEDRLRA